MSTIARIRDAQSSLTGVIRRTPLLSSPALDRIAGRRVWVKAESLQHTGSFKARGAWFALSQLDTDARRRGVIAYSSGNHAQGVAHAAEALGAPAIILMPADAPEVKIAGTRAFGAEVVLYDRANERREEIGEALAQERGLTLIPPYDHPDVIAGQGTVGLELAEQLRDSGVERADVAVCCGGGGLTAGIALALTDRAPGLRARPVEPEGFDDVTRSLAAGALRSNAALSGSICDAILTRQPGNLTFPILHAHCGPGIVVSDRQAERAMAAAFDHLNLVVEPGGAVALAAALFHPETFEGPDVAAIATGGNVERSTLTKALSATS